jgi:uncharacterized protein YndB with AHSA1/START domain
MASIAGTQSLEIRRKLEAPPARVYDAWTTPELLTRWFAPSPDFAVIVHRAETHVGGKYRIEMRHASGKSHIVVGEYRELNRPTRLVFTWAWEGSPMTDTMVEVEFRPSGSGTEVVLTHSRFATEAERDEHLKGWNGCLSQIEGAVSGH